MTKAEFAVVGRWILAGIPLGLGICILTFNLLRYVPGLRRGGRTRGSGGRLPSSLPLVGSLGVVLGLYLAPTGFRAAYLSILSLEIFSVDISVGTSIAGGDRPDSPEPIRDDPTAEDDVDHEE